MATQQRVQLPKPKSTRSRQRRGGGDPATEDLRLDTTAPDTRRVLDDAERFLRRTAEAA